MKKESIQCEYAITGKSPVGLFKEEEGYKAIMPYGFCNMYDSKGVQSNLNNILKKYIRCINKALSKKNVKQQLDTKTSKMNNPLVALKIVFDYVQNGMYKEFEKEQIRDIYGKIDFKNTIKKVKAQICDDEAIYTEFIVSKKKIVSQEIVAMAQGNVINHFMDNGGEIIFGNLIRVNVKSIALDQNLVNQLRVILANSFNSRKQQLIRWIVEYIKGAIVGKEKGNWNYTIIASTLWEEMVDACYSNQKKRNKTIYGRQYKMYMDEGISLTSSFTQHDTIYENEEVVMIIDAKMYESAKELLNDEVLGKQFGYYMSAKKKNPNKKVYNILIKPYVRDNDQKSGFIAKVPAPDDDDPENIVLIYAADFIKVMDNYYSNKKMGKNLLDEVKRFREND